MATTLKLVGTGTAGNAGTPLNFGQTHLTVPAAQMWVINSISMKWVTCAKAGNRQAGALLQSTQASTYQRAIWTPTQAASLTRYYRAFVGAPQSAAFGATTAYAPIPDNIQMPGGFTIQPYDFAATVDDGNFTYASSTIDSITATTVVSNATPYPNNFFVGATLYMGASTAVITGNTTSVLTFAGGWVGGTPSPANYYVWFDTMELTVAYDAYAQVII